MEVGSPERRPLPRLTLSRPPRPRGGAHAAMIAFPARVAHNPHNRTPPGAPTRVVSGDPSTLAILVSPGAEAGPLPTDVLSRVLWPSPSVSLPGP
jgi:hypothetical protein